jgi:hypothetical protein
MTQGKYGAEKEMTPNMAILTSSFLLPHTYVIINVKADPRNGWLFKTNGASTEIHVIPKISIKIKELGLPLKSPSSSCRQ